MNDGPNGPEAEPSTNGDLCETRTDARPCGRIATHEPEPALITRLGHSSSRRRGHSCKNAKSALPRHWGGRGDDRSQKSM